MASRGGVVARIVLVFLAAILVGRLSLERTGLGLALLPLVAVGLFLLMTAWIGWRAALVLVAMFLIVGGVARYVLFTTPSAWIGVLLVLVVSAVLWMAFNVARAMAHDARVGGESIGQEGRESTIGYASGPMEIGGEEE